ncbi:uncharacterized protein VTP21DRAFT_1417 [Calcarisporiella thermophila]|uniref:uncharacterized protein n=1 Tax=Calcarisporiella thermophila TaxID=911321 RepID=UPI0037448BAF
MSQRNNELDGVPGQGSFSASDLQQPHQQQEDHGGTKRVHDDVEDDSEDDDERPKGAKRTSMGRRKIRIEYISDKNRRHITFSKRKAGIMKKAYELSTLTGTQVLLLVVSETGLVYTFTTPKLQPLVTKPEGKNLIQACLNAPDPATSTNPSQQEQSSPSRPPLSTSAAAPNSLEPGNDSLYGGGDDRRASHPQQGSAPAGGSYLSGMSYGQGYQMSGQMPSLPGGGLAAQYINSAQYPHYSQSADNSMYRQSGQYPPPSGY